MTKAQAIYNFFNSFGVQAYPVTSVPDDITYPWLTYENTLGNQGDEVSISVQIWYHTTSDAVLNAKAQTISDGIGIGGVILHCDDGSVWVKRGTPWMNSINDSVDSSVKGRVLNITLEFL